MGLPRLNSSCYLELIRMDGAMLVIPNRIALHSRLKSIPSLWGRGVSRVRPFFSSQQRQFRRRLVWN